MAKMNGSILLTERQMKQLRQGKVLSIKREGRVISIGLKEKHKEKIAILRQIQELQKKLREK